ncbi:MAG: PhnD/SsuA/transferrin family substrate-binding protein, partial [Candidatus Marithrix sp.]|nr:PhnD/SsuA/transferrin family substrate-binding protein [Candidatus Marithrix sp.]
MQKIFLSAFLILLTPILMAEPVQEPYIFGVHPYLTSKGLLEKFTPLIEYLSDELDRPVILRVAKTYADHIELTG